MKPDVSLAVVTDEYQEVCPHCGRPMQQVPYYSAVMSKGGTHRQIASLTQDKIVTTYNLSFITTIFGGYCPTCTLNAISKQNEIIREQNEHKSKEWNSLSEKERTARYCPWMTIVFLASSAFSILMLILTFLKFSAWFLVRAHGLQTTGCSRCVMQHLALQKENYQSLCLTLVWRILHRRLSNAEDLLRKRSGA